MIEFLIKNKVQNSKKKSSWIVKQTILEFVFQNFIQSVNSTSFPYLKTLLILLEVGGFMSKIAGC